MYAAMVDALNMLVWMQSKDGANNRNRPKSLMQALTGEEEKAGPDVVTFDSAAAFEARRMAILEVVT